MSNAVVPLPGDASEPTVHGPWLLGFHGAVQPARFAGDPPSFLRTLVLSRRSLGTQRMSTLCGLPSARTGMPMRDSGARGIGEPTPGATALDAWDRVEPVAAYLDRRLARASIIYLPNRSRGYALTKRLLDIIGAVVLLVLSSPIMVLLALLIRLDSPGPALFRQQRVTLGGQLFTFYKFRTMWVDARERFPDLYDYQRADSAGAVYYKLADDPRCTRVGRWLRRTTLDELPNLLCVLTGQMSLVGPRPELPEVLAHYTDEELALFFTKAGLTGLAQIAGRSLLTIRERIGIDLRYVAQQTVLLDLRILVHTVSAVLVGRGAF